MRQVLKGSTNVSVDVYIIDSTDGTPELGVLFNTAGMDLEYRREVAVVVNVTEVTLAALTTAHADGGFLEIGHGLYRFDVPDAAFASAAGVETVSIQGTVTGMIVLPQTIQLVDFDPEDGVRLGLTALPDAAADAAGGLPISDAGGLDLDARLDAAITSRLAPTVAARTLDISAGGEAGLDWANIGSPTTAVDLSGTDIQLCDTVATLTGHTGQTADHTAGIADIPTVAEFNARTLVAASYALEATHTSMKGATFVEGTDSLEAIRDRGDAAWITGAGGSNPVVLQNTTIATLASQTSFTLTAGSADNGAYDNMLIVVEDSATATQKAVGVISAYTGGTLTVTLREDPGIFVMAVGDTVDVVAISPDIVEIVADTAEIGVAGAGLTNINLPNQTMDIVGEITGNLSGSVGSVTGGALDATVAKAATVAQETTLTARTLVSASYALEASVQTLLTRIPAALFTGMTSLAEWLGLLAGKQAGDATARTEIRATGAGSGTYDETTDSQEGLEGQAAAVLSRLPVALVGGRIDANTSAFAGVSDGATRIARTTQAPVLGTVGVGSTTTNIVVSSLDPSAGAIDQFKGRIVTFQQNTSTGTLKGQATDIIGNTAGGDLTVTALTTAPASGDVFVMT